VQVQSPGTKLGVSIGIQSEVAVVEGRISHRQLLRLIRRDDTDVDEVLEKNR
jgi:hypothetical protein